MSTILQSNSYLKEGEVESNTKKRKQSEPLTIAKHNKIQIYVHSFNDNLLSSYLSIRFRLQVEK